MGKKVKVFVFDNDHRVEEKEYELNEAGDKIAIVKEGAGYFMPEIDNDSFLEFPSWKKYLLVGERTYKRRYFVNNRGKKCYNFKTGEISLPDIEGLKKAIANDQLAKLGSEETKTPWQVNLILLLSLLMFIILANISGVFR
jgi:hypothetical protein